MVVFVGHGGRGLGEYAGVDHLAQEYGVGLGFHLVDHLAQAPAHGVLQNGQALLIVPGHTGELVHVAAGTEAEAADQARVAGLAEHVQREHAALGNGLVGQVLVVDAHRDGGRLSGDLHGAVGGAAHRGLAVHAGHDVNAVRHAEKETNVHFYALLCRAAAAAHRCGVVFRIYYQYTKQRAKNNRFCVK